MQELKQRLVAALDQLGERGAAGDGMEALHDWLHRHPQLNLDAFLAGANERLRTYFYQVLPSNVLLPPTCNVAVAANHRADLRVRRYLTMFYGWSSSAHDKDSLMKFSRPRGGTSRGYVGVVVFV